MKLKMKSIRRYLLGPILFFMILSASYIVKAAELTPPENVSVTVNGSTSLEVSWSTVEGANYYEISRSTNPNNGFTIMGTLKGWRKVDSPVTYGTTYYYRVRAFYQDETGSRKYGPYSEVVSGCAILSTPAKPRVNQDEDSLKISWDKIPAADKYILFYSENPYSGYVRLCETSSNSFVHKNLRAGTKYYYIIQAICHENGNVYTKYSEPTLGTVNTYPCNGCSEGPDWIEVSQSAHDTMYVKWDLFYHAYGYPEGTKFDIFRSTSPDSGFELLTTTSIDFSAFESKYGYSYVTGELGVTYYYKVREHCCYNYHESVFSPVAEFTLTEYPLLSSPTLTLETNKDYSVTLRWNAVDGAEGYRVYRSLLPDSDYKLLKTVTGYSYTDERGGSANNYHYKVVAYYTIDGIDIPSADSNVVRCSDGIGSPAPLVIEPNDANSLKITWQSIEGAECYQIYRSESASGRYVLIGEFDPNTQVKISTHLTTGKPYYYKLRAYRENIDNKGYSYLLYSEYSPVSAGVPLAAPKTISVTPNTSNSLKVEWSAVQGAQYYELYRSTSPDSGYVDLNYYPSNTLSKISVSLASGTRYYYKVRAFCIVDGNRYYSPYSPVGSEVTSTTAPTLSAPTITSVKENTYNSLKVTWGETAGAQYYELYRSTNQDSDFKKLGTYDNGTFSAVSRSLGCGNTYYYKVRAYCWFNGVRVYSPYSKVVSGKPVLNAPTNVKAVRASASSVKVTWDKVDGANYYQVYRATSPNGKYSLIGVFDENTRTKMSVQLKTGTTYYYKVRCYRWVLGERVFSSFSSIKSATP